MEAAMVHAPINVKTDVDGALALIDELKTMLTKMVASEEAKRAALPTALSPSLDVSLLGSLSPPPWALTLQQRLAVAQFSQSAADSSTSLLLLPSPSAPCSASSSRSPTTSSYDNEEMEDEDDKETTVAVRVQPWLLWWWHGLK
jgi:hypothetical protein